MCEPAVAVYVHGYELFLPAVLTGEDYPATVELGLPAYDVCRGPVATPTPENIVNGIDEPAHVESVGGAEDSTVKGEMREKVSGTRMIVR